MSSFHSHSTIDSFQDLDYCYDLTSGYVSRPSIREQSPLSLTIPVEPSHCSSSHSSPTRSFSSKGHDEGYATRSEMDRQRKYPSIIHEYEYNEEDASIESSDEGYSFSETTFLHHPLKSPRRVHSIPPPSPRHSSVFFYSATPSSPCLSSPIPPSYSYSEQNHRREIELQETEPEPEILRNHILIKGDGDRLTPKSSRNEALRRQWSSIALQVQFGVFRARRRMRKIVGKGLKKS